MRLYTYRKPQLPADGYRIFAKQEVKAGDEQRTYEAEMRVYVRYPRFVLNETEIYEVYPPEGGMGQYCGQLPFIQFYKNTLPWMRGDGTVPWMALFVLEEADGAVIVRGELKDFFDVPTGTAMMSSGIEWDNGEKETDPCMYVDIPAKRFQELAPTYEELELLAHVKEYDVQNQVKSEGMSPSALSCLISNQYITSNSSCILLVSIEGMEDFLKNPSNQMSYETVRLPVLKEWRVSQAYDHESFAELLQRIDVGVIGQRDAEGPLKKGFVPIQYEDRVGNRLIAWYHGPFVSAALGELTDTSGEDADQYLRFDPELAMFDVSYSAAYQLGQLLAMNHRDAVRELSQLKKEIRQRQRVLHQKNILQRHRECSETEMLLQLMDDLEA